MANRMLRDWTFSDKMNGLSVHAERFFTRLIMKADDFGCFYADQGILKASLFPKMLDTVREADLLRWMAECQKAELIVLYENSGKRYLQIIDFNQRLRAKRSKFPLPAECGHVADIKPPEVEVEVEVEEKLNTPNGFYEKEDGKLFSIDHCAEVAMRDQKWMMDSKATPEKIELFKRNLSGQGVNEKTFKDFKKHFFFWSEKQKTKNGTHQQSTNGKQLGKSSGFGLLNSLTRQDDTG